MSRVIKLKDLDLNFKFEIAKTKNGKSILKCIQCGMCSSSCPFSQELDVKPHEIIRMIMLGMRTEVLSSKKIWACATCYMCAERCPHGVELGNVLMAVANIASKERGVPHGLSRTGRMLLKTGRVLNISKMRIKEREKLGLPVIPTADSDQISQLLQQISVNKLIEEKKIE